MKTRKKPVLAYRPLTADCWGDFENLFGPRGACGGCWCMWWRLKRSEFNRQKGEQNRLAMKSLVESGQVPGILGYLEGKAVGWCAVAPRETLPGLERARTLKPIDREQVWSIACLFVRKEYRGKGVSVKMLRAAADYVRSRKGRLLEGYPMVPWKSKVPDAFVWTGLTPAFHKAGFANCAKPSKTRRIVRLRVGK